MNYAYVSESDTVVRKRRICPARANLLIKSRGFGLLIRSQAHLPGRDWALKCAIGSQNRFARFAVRASKIAECPKTEVLLYALTKRLVE